ncbi:SDR family NAD(P)-dependent oxidoreductase [Georgenia alba]|uniref:SDR family NAD(P)-dependent oxidoreductase n=1 Tax=Georgenia alba TaxID=2233858 RepID=A0ABW2QES6_9MICO
MHTSAGEVRRTALITGGSGGLGQATAQALLAHGGWDVIVTGRDETTLAAAADRLGKRATGRRLDLGSLAEVRDFARDLPSLDALICNAGLHVVGMRRTRDGVEETFGVNHLAHFLLVREVLPRMRAPGRVVLVTSATHDPAQRTGFPPPRYTSARALAYPEPSAESALRAGQRRYTVSKLCAVLATYELARRVPREQATFAAFDPGQMPGTGLARDYPGVRGLAWRFVMPALVLVPGINRHTPRRSAARLARLVVDPHLTAVTGRYYSDGREARSSAESYDAAKAKDLWETSVGLVEEILGTSDGVPASQP